MAATLDITYLRTLVAIDECGGFGRAAAALRMSQPTVSQHVRLLERRIGRPLVEKDGRNAKFTAAGENLLEEARRIIAVHDEALARLDVDNRQPIAIGSAETAAEQILPELLATLQDAYPDRPVRFVIDRSTQMIEAVSKGTIDLALVLDTEESSVGVDIATLSLRWFAATNWVSPARDEPLPLVAYVEPCGMRQRAFRALQSSGRSAAVIAESGSLEGVIGAARAGLGVAVLPSIGRGPRGLAARTDLPDLGRIFVRVVARRGADSGVVRTAVAALEDFFATEGYLHAVS
ncbi:MAG: LysR substrate-binding domain-containing protein [Microbacterium sp.]